MPRSVGTNNIPVVGACIQSEPQAVLHSPDTGTDAHRRQPPPSVCYAGSWPSAFGAPLHASRCPPRFQAAFWHSGEQCLPGHALSAEHLLSTKASLGQQHTHYTATLQPAHSGSLRWLSETPCRAVHLHAPQVHSSSDECLKPALWEHRSHADMHPEVACKDLALAHMVSQQAQ